MDELLCGVTWTRPDHKKDNIDGKDENSNGRKMWRGRAGSNSRESADRAGVAARGNDGAGEGARRNQSRRRHSGASNGQLDADRGVIEAGGGGRGRDGRGGGRGRGRGGVERWGGRGGVGRGGGRGEVDIWRGRERERGFGRGDRGGGSEGRGERGRGAARGRDGGQGSIAGREGERGGIGAGGRRGGERRDGDAGGRRMRNEGWNESSDSTSRDGTPRGPRLGYKTLEELSGKEPAQVAITLSSNPALQALLDEREMRQDLVQLVCYVLSRAFQAQTDRATLLHLANTVKNSGFLRTILPFYVANMASESSSDRRDQYPLHLCNILAVVFEVLKTFPASSVQTVSMLVTLLPSSINSLRASGVDISPQIDGKLQELQGLVNHLQEKSREGTLRSDKDTYSLLHAGGENPGVEEQQDFRTLPIYPTPEEFHEEQRPFLRPNLTNRRYASTHVYLDTHFRLLREDFVRPLREGIQELLRHQREMGKNDKPLRNARFDDIRVYLDTRLVVPKCTLDGIAFIVQFDPEPLKFVRWQNSKRLLYGSLVCLSCDKFESFLFATVCHRDPEELQNGRVQLVFSEESRDKLVTIQTDQSFLMVETTAYFEAYRYVLEGLQEQEEAHLPFQRYIVDCQSDVLPPAYLNQGDSYKLSDIADPEYKGKIQPFHCLKPEAWPTMEELGLDESQMKALQLALTKEMAIIQGPPGTGKTYTGLKIAQALLTNSSLWSSELIGNAPMLVVCYTNHALDQFLEGIHKFLPDGIVRVGGRSSSEVLKRFNLRELTQSMKSRRNMPRHLSSAYSEIFSELRQEEIEIQSQAVKLECSLKGVIREAFLEKFISEEHWLSLQHCPAVQNQDEFEIFGEKKKKPCLIMEWLGIGSTVHQQRATEEANINTGSVTFRLEFKLQLIFTEDLANPFQAAFQNLQTQVATALDNLYGVQYPNFLGTVMDGFSQGLPGVVVNASLTFDNAVTVTAPKTNAVATTLVEAATKRGSGFTLPVNASTVVVTTMETEEDDEMIDIAEEADLIQAERYIEDTDHRSDRDKEKARVMEETLREVQETMLATMFEDAEIHVEQSEGGFQMQRQQIKKMKNKVKKELGKSSAMSEEEEEAVWDVWALSLPDRWRLYRLWIARYRVEMRTKALQSEQAYQNAVDRLADIRRHESLFVLKTATVIGMTTTGAAKFRKTLQELQPRLVIVEEAAEVLEAHTITTLSQACQHLILIGDHQQLRPSATVYDLAKNFNLEVSMFERLIKMNFPYVRLNYQHRMRPEIACLLTPHIYDELQNHPSVFDYENIKGLNANLFFVEHNHKEEEIRDGKSHQNKHEAKFVVSLCQYLLFQGYKPEQITILTTYTGQFQCLRTLMPAKTFSGVKVHVVDKYQGEENDIVLLSLVRSNKPGFLNIPNRVCVALSRAKKGLYCIGNSAMLGKVPLWSNIFHTLRGKGQMGPALTLCCQNHPDRQVTVSCAADFNQAPEGGCTLPCEFRLECGHVCASVCHPYDADHKKYKCLKKCQKVLCDLKHRCPNDCQKACPKKCPEKVEKTIPKCQHKQMMPCHQDPETFVCQEPCQKMLQCLHPCASVCGAPCTSKCMVKDTITLKCGHNKLDSCYYKTAENKPNCSAPCNELLKCGHTCKGTCHRCHQGRYHHLCAHRCERLLICSHKCREPCLPDWPSCRMPCENRCIHSKCKNLCGQPCAPCIEPCAWRCPHQRCTKLCHEPCDRLPCDRPCDKKLACGHDCIGLCGEKCPNKCRICDRDAVAEIFFGTEDDPDALFVQLEDCGHVIESSGMDTWMDDNQQANEGEEVAIKLKECPKCRTPIRKNVRYGTHINRSLNEIEKVKEKINGCPTDIAQKKLALEEQWREKWELQQYLPREYSKIESELRVRHFTEKDLWVLENKMAFLERVGKLKKTQKEQMSGVKGVCFEAKVETFVTWLLDVKQKFTVQQASDLQGELQRLTLLAELEARCNMRRGESVVVDREIESIRRVLEKLRPFTEEDEARVKQGLKDLNGKIPHLGISEDERKMIVSAMKMQPGHWYKCPNGHVYVITECGGAMESRRCTECNATIGGANHALADGNQVASEMDGARHAAWSEAANMLNFDLINFN